MAFTPLHDRVLVRRVESDEKTKGGLIIPDSAKEKPAEGIVVVHPNWWGQPPAVLKGWVDRVFRPGVAYRFEEGDGGEGIPIGLLKARAAIVFNTANTPDAREQSVFGDPLESLWKRCIFDLCGITTVHRRTFGVIVTSTAQQRQVWLHDVGELVSSRAFIMPATIFSCQTTLR